MTRFLLSSAPSGGVAQLVRALPCHGRGYGFEPRRSRHFHFQNWRCQPVQGNPPHASQFEVSTRLKTPPFASRVFNFCPTVTFAASRKTFPFVASVVIDRKSTRLNS